MERKATLKNRLLRQKRVRVRARGSLARPRLSVTITNRHVLAQLIDDEHSRTLLASTSVNSDKLKKASLTEVAQWVGADIAQKAAQAKVKRVVFDRGQKLYHGRIKTLAEAAREGGLEF